MYNLIITLSTILPTYSLCKLCFILHLNKFVKDVHVLSILAL